MAKVAGQRGRRVRLLLVLVVLGSLAACSGDPEPPAPTVSTQEVEQRLDAHMARIREALRDGVSVSEPVRSSEAGCPGGPEWGVVPRLTAEMTDTMPDTDRSRARNRIFFHEVSSWLLDNGFTETAKTQERVQETGYLVDVAEATGVDGTKARIVGEPGAKLTVTLTGPCSWPSDREGGPPQGKLPPLAAPSEPKQSKDVLGWDVCETPKRYAYNKSAPRYTGPGPHTIIMIGLMNDNRRVASTTELPKPWRPADEQSKPTSAQLVVCVSVTEGAAAPGLQITCHYYVASTFPVTFSMQNSTYHYVVREALTGRQVGEFSLPGTEASQDSCPDMIDPASGKERPLLLAVSNQALYDQLRPFAEGVR